MYRDDGSPWRINVHALRGSESRNLLPSMTPATHKYVELQNFFKWVHQLLNQSPAAEHRPRLQEHRPRLQEHRPRLQVHVFFAPYLFHLGHFFQSGLSLLESETWEVGALGCSLAYQGGTSLVRRV